ncbi:MAG: glycine cleavage system aminomethyltransferase GcvT [Acidimicrobiia bacterium]
MLTSPLHDRHLALHAKFAEFGGWEMPLQYGSALDEHVMVRNACGIFDVSHLGVLHVTGAEAFAVLDRVFTNDLRRIGPGRTQYTHLLNDRGGVVDDCIIWWLHDADFLVIPNASNTEPIEEAIHAVAADADVVARTWPGAERAMLAIQGPTARAVVAAVLGDAAADVPRFYVQEHASEFGTCVVAGTGYTGEDGVEILLPIAHGTALWDALVANGANPVGLAARDSLRLEAALPLHGHELTEEIASIEAGLGWAVRCEGRDFPGVGAARQLELSDHPRRLVGLRSETRQFPRQGYGVKCEGVTVGTITSGNFSPSLGIGIALALLDVPCEVGTEVVVDVRGKPLSMRVAALPFIPHRKRLT